MGHWTVEQAEAVIADAKDYGDWRGTPSQHATAALADLADWLLGELRASRRLARQGIEAAVTPDGALRPGTRREHVQQLARVLQRGPSEEDEGLEATLRASVAHLAGVPL